jgi:hypothetical protein
MSAENIEVEENIEEKTGIKESVAGVGKTIPISRVTNPSPSEITEQKALEEEAKLNNVTEEGKEKVEAAVVTEEKKDEPILDAKSLTDEQLKELYESRFTKSSEPTDEEKAAKEKESEKKMLDLFIENGGTAETFVQLKEILSTDLASLSKSVVISEMKAQGFDDDFINEVLVERYYQINPDELEQGYDENDEDYEARKEKVRKKVTYGNEVLEGKSKKVKENAQSVFDNLRKAISDKESLVSEESKFIAKIDEVSKNLPRKMTLSLGKLNNEDLGSIEVDIPEEEIKALTETFKDPIRREQILYNNEGELNIEAISHLMLKNSILERAARESLLKGRTSQVEALSKVFPYKNPQDMGVGNNNAGSKGSNGKIAGFGSTQRIK